MVNLTRIYTRTGDAGKTRLSDNAEVPKTDLRVEAYGAVDETNSNLALAVAHGGLPEKLVEMLSLIRNELFDVGADLSTPLHPHPEYPPLRIEQSSIDRLEEWWDELGAFAPSFWLAVALPQPNCTWLAPCAGVRSGWPGGQLSPTALNPQSSAAKVGSTYLRSPT